MNVLDSVLELPFVKRTRRNHALEHATIHMLSRRVQHVPMAGRSTPSGFYLYGNIPTDHVVSAVNEALARLKAGESQLAIHPNCGTNLVTAAGLSGLAAFTLLNTGRRERNNLERLPSLFLVIAAALVAAQPIGQAAQQHITTLADLGNLRVTSIRQVGQGRMVIHRVDTASS